MSEAFKGRSPVWGVLLLCTLIALFAFITREPDKITKTASMLPGIENEVLPPSLPEVENRVSLPTFYSTEDTVYVGDFKYKVRAYGFNKQLGSEYYNKTADGIYLIIKLDVTNLGSAGRMIDNSMFRLKDSLNTEYNPSSEGSTALEMEGSHTLLMKECNPGIRKNGWLCFEVPKEGNYYLQLTDGYADGRTESVFIK